MRAISPRFRTWLAALVITLVGVLGGCTSVASAAYTANLNQAKPSNLQASAASDYQIDTSFAGDKPKSLTLNFPPGQLGVVSNATQCTVTNFNNDNCANSSVVGDVSVAVTAALFGINLTATGKIYRLVPTGNEVMRIGMSVSSALSAPLYIQGAITLRDDYGITAVIPSIPNVATVTIFGIPTGNTGIQINTMSVTMYGRVNDAGAAAPIFFFNPASCAAANMTMSSTSYGGTTDTGGPTGYTPTGCGTVPFTPTVAFTPAGSAASSSTAFTVTASTPFTANAASMQSPFKNATLTLPPGVQLSAAANSDGTLAACSDAQFGYTTPTVPDTCPAGAKVGTVDMDSPLVGLISGDVFLAQPAAGPPDLIQLFIVAEGGTAADEIRVKLKAQVAVDPTTGAHTVTLLNLPPQPVKSFKFTFRGGPGVTNPGTRQPRTCGTYTGSGAFTPFSTATATPASGNYTVTTNCPPAGQFAPTISMTTTPTTAGSTSATGVTTMNFGVGDEPVSNLTASLPPGLLANLNVLTKCTLAQAGADNCPATSKIGTVGALSGQTSVPGSFTGDVFLTDAPSAGTVAGLYLHVPVVVGPINIDTLKIQASLKLRTDYGIDVVSAIPATVRGIQLDLQQLKLNLGGFNGFFLNNPSSCAAATISGNFTSSLGTTKTATSAMTFTGCPLTYAPTLAFSSTPASAGGASAFGVSVNVPATSSASKKISVTLPDGVSLSPSANSDGNLAGCSDAQFTINDFADPTCPANSNVGTVTMATPSVGALTGTVYLGTAPGGGHTARVLVDAKSTLYGAAVRVKLLGLLDVNATTGNVTAVFDNLPPVQFTNFTLNLRGGSNPVLSMPRVCGTDAGSSTMTPVSGPVASPTASVTFNVNCGLDNSFAPTFANSITPTVAGGPTTMTSTVNVPERHKAIDNLQLSLPAGMLANIDGAPRCSIASATAGTCTAATKIGTVTALAGQGATPGSFSGELFLTDAPTASDVVGIAVKLPAVVGPIDLGNVITIASVKLRPADYGIDVSAAIPTSVQGIPLYLQQLKLIIDKAGFLTNPMVCGATTTTSTLHAVGGPTVTPAAVAGSVTGCPLPVSPTVSFTGAPADAAGPSAFTVGLTLAAGNASVKKVAVDLPTGVSLSSSINSASDLGTGCTAAQFAIATFADPTCPAGSSVGVASITVPQVGVLSGNVYVASVSPAGAIAGLYLDAKSVGFGSNVRVKLAGEVDVNAGNGQTTAIFDNAPAVAFSSMQLTMRGGSNPAISMPRTCGTPSGSATVTSQAGVTATSTAALAVTNNCAVAATFAATGSVALSNLNAGASPTLTTTVNVPNGARELSKVAISLPAGLLANVNGLARCSVAAATAGTCTAATKIGTITANSGQGTVGGSFAGDAFLVDAPTASDMVAIGLSLPIKVGPIDLGSINVVAPVKLRSDYGIDITADVPTSIKGIPIYLRQMQIVINKSGFLFNPSGCGAVTSNLTLTSASYSGASSTATPSSTQTIANCAGLAFSPTVSFGSSPQSAGGASAFTTNINLPSSPAQSALGVATVTLPTGVSLSPSINSDGLLVGCTDAQFGKATPLVDPTCPAASKIGTTTIQTGAVGALAGDVYLADDEQGHTARVMVFARSSAFPGAAVKMTGAVDVNAGTGVTTAVFSDAPAVPFSAFSLTFRGGTTPAISMPRTCGTPTGSASLTALSGGAAVNSNANLTVDVNCTESTSFTPTFSNVISPTTAGANTTMVSTVNIPQRHRFLDKLDMSLPAGLLANVASWPRCSIAAANAGTCAASSKIGTVTALAGQGTTPGTFSGELFLTDAPTASDVVGIAVKLPAVVGPVDLGNVITIASVKLRPADYGIDVSAVIPTDVKGVPLFLRQLKLNVTQAGFLTNPTTCAASSTAATLHGAGGSTSNLSDPFTATNCAGLGFNPSVSFSGAPTTAGGASAFTAKITAPSGGQAALKKAVVDLPTGVSLSSSINSANDLGTGCTAAQFTLADFADPTCGAGTDIGTASLDVPQVGTLSGKVYLASTAPGSSIAGLYLDAKSATFGSTVRVKLAGQVDVNAGTGLTTVTFDNAPAIAFTNFQLTMRGGTNPAVSMPRVNGTPTGTATLTPQSGTAVVRTGSLTVTASGSENSFGATGSVALSTVVAGASPTVTTTVNVPAANRELAKVAISLPAGLLANIDGLTRCSVAVATAGNCTAATKIGTITASAGQGTTPGTFAGDAFLVDAPTASDMIAIGLSLPVKVGPVDLGKINVVAPVKLRADYGVDITADVPTSIKGIPIYLRQMQIVIDKSGFFFNPSTCGVKTSTLAMTSASYSGATSTANASSNATVTGCAALGFNPSVSFGSSPQSAGGSSAFTTNITLPSSPAQSALGTAVVTLPTGVSLSPSINSAGTLVGCSDAQFGKATPLADPTCPALSKIGTATVTTGAVGGLTGDVFLADTAPGHVARVMVFARSTNFPGAAVKMTGVVDVDAATGITTATFADSPEVPFTAFGITFRGGTNPAISMPRTCGTPTGSAALTPMGGGALANRTANLTVDVNCTDSASFTPTFTNVVSPTTAGANTTMVSTVNIPQRHRFLDKLQMSLPAGLLANVATAPRCSILAATAGTCAASTKIGSVTALAGQGTTPGTFTGELFLTDAPTASDVVGIAVKLPAVVGPVDLGNVITIASVKLRPTDYGIDVSADIPTDVKGVPLFMQQLKLTIDKAGFLTNPTSCAAMSTTTSLHGQGGSTATPSAPFQATNCAGLTYNPSVSFTGAPANAAGASTFTTRIQAPAGGQAMKKAVVDLPTGVSLSASINSANDLGNGCSAAQFDQATFSDPTCPAGSNIGVSSLDVPQVGTLVGNVYVASTTPSGAIAGLYLDAKSVIFGNNVRVKLAGEVDVDATSGKTTAVFDNAPSIAYTDFQLIMRGGTNPAISMPRTCGTPTGTATLTSQAGTVATKTGTLTVDQNCGLANTFAATGSVSLSNTNAAEDTSLTTTINVPSGNRELAKVNISLPAGLLAKLQGQARCTVAAATAGTCAASTEIGTVGADAGQGTTPSTFNGKAYLVDAPTASDMAAIGLSIPVKVGPIDLGSVNVVAPIKLRSDYGIDITADVPTQIKGIPMYMRQLRIAITKSGFMFNPSTCGVKATTLGLTSASYGGATSTASSTSNVTIGNCGAVAFNPSVSFSATPPKAGGAGAFTTSISLPSSPAQAALGAATVVLPTGVSLSPSIDSAGTLTGCTDAQLDQATPSVVPTCPTLSKIGDTSIQTDSVGQLTGSVYLAATAPGHLARIFVHAKSVNYPGAGVKMIGTVDVNSSTGVTTAVFPSAPEVPFTQFDITFQGGTNPAISLPRTCGTPTGTAALTSQAGGAAVNRSANLTINTNCTVPGQFTPTATTVSAPSKAAAQTAFTTAVNLPEGQEELSNVKLSLPVGLLAKIDGHARCSIAAATAGTCAAATKVGTIAATAGQGTNPGSYSGSVYLTDAPSSGDLVGLAIALPVQVGHVGATPIVDLGQVTSVGSIKLRQDYGIDIDMPVPTSVQGIPMALRSFALTINDSNFMINPPTCTGNAVTGTITSKQGSTSAVSTSLAIDSCATTQFDPSVSFSASPAQPAASSSFKTQLTVPAGSAGNEQSPVKKAVVTLPTGVSLSASANAGGDLVGCTDAQFAASTWADPTCPAGSNVGTVSIQTPSIGAVTGTAYLAATAPGSSIARLLLDATSSTYGNKARIKVQGTIDVDAGTGATTATFDNLPPVAFTDFSLTLRGGSNPVISLPRTCGTFAGSAVLTPTAGTVASRMGSLVLNVGCPAANQFGPTMDLDLTPADAGANGTLTTTVKVPGGDQELSKIKLNMPDGLTAKLKGAPRCSITDAQNDACDPSTQVGIIDAKVGVDDAPYGQSGKVYLTDGRNGNVAGMALVLPAVVGPIDLGKVITIADVQLHSPDLALQITADVPTTQKGVRLDVRELKITINKAGFIVNPSSCGTLTGTGTFTSVGAQTATDDGTISVPAASCAAQNFDPQISFSVGNPHPAESSDFTTSVALTDAAGPESPFKSVTVRLPDGMSLSASAGARGDLAGCSDAQFHQDDLSVANTCPAGSEIGTTKFETDLVGDLIGKAYLAPATAGNLARVFLETTASDVPNLTVRIVGVVKVDPVTGATDAVFDDLPAIPVTKFNVTFRGSDAPVLAMPRLCGTAAGSGTFAPVNGSSTQLRNASLVFNTACPDPAAFAPTNTIGRSTTAAGQSMTFTETVTVPAKQQELSKLKMQLPAGLLGKISSIPACSVTDAGNNACAPASKVGTVTAQVGVSTAPFTVTGSAFLVSGDSDSIARLAMVLPAKVGPVDLGNVVTLADLKLRSDYGLDVVADTIPTQVKGVRLDLHQFALSIDKADFMVNPVACGDTVATTTLGSKQSGSQVRTQTLTTDQCDQLQLNTSLGYTAAPASPLTASTVTTKIRASADSGHALDAMKNVHIVMPDGMSLSPSAGATGNLAECSAAQFNGADISVDAACPAGSKVGTVAFTSPMVGDLSGDAFLGAKTGGHFASIFLQGKAPAYPSLRVKLSGTLDVDATTGRLTADFTDLPQVQVSGIDLALNGGSAPVLSLPRTCGDFGSSLSILRYGGSTSTASGNLTLNADCPDANAFSPAIALSANPTQAAASTALTTTVTVPGRQQELKSLNLAMPTGLLGRLTVAPQCAVDAARADNCPAESQVGTVTARVGVATAPYSVTGKVYMTGGFDGSIAGLMFSLPAKVGPIDLGNVVTMSQVKITGNDLRMSIIAPEIPTRVKGIPLNISELSIGIDRAGVVLNPSSCEAKRADASFGSAQGGSASAGADFQATGCAGLNWKPGIKVAFSGAAADVKKLGHPTVTTVIDQTDNQGNLKTAKVTLPDGVSTDLNNINPRTCASPEAAAAGQCAEKAKIGTATIVTSALPNPVTGSVYLVTIAGQTLPGMAIRIRDQIDFDIVGTIKTAGGRVVANFDGLPDTPISKMTLVFQGGSAGPLQLATDICGVAGKQTNADLTSQSGVVKNFAIPIDCNGATTPLTPGGDVHPVAVASFKPGGSGAALTFALSNPNGIRKIVVKMPKGAIFTKAAAKLVKKKIALTGAKAKFKVANGERRLAISIIPTVPGTLVTKVKFSIPAKAIKINYKVKKVLNNRKISKKKRAKMLAKLMTPGVTMMDGQGKTWTVKTTIKVALKK